MMKIKTLHLIEDDPFIEYAIDIFNSCSSLDNHYILLQLDKEPVRKIKYKGIQTILYGSDEYHNLINEVTGEYKNVVVHFLTDEKVHFVNSVKVKNLVWIIWGIDAYTHPKLLPLIFGNETLKMLGGAKILVKNRRFYNYYYLVRTKLEDYYFLLRHQQFSPRQQYYNALNKFNYCFVLTESEKCIYQKILSKSIIFKKFYYGFLEDHIVGVPDTYELKSEKKNILLGNSSTSSNNHLEILIRLSQIDLGERLVVVPLSYGSDDYANRIIKIGKKLLGKNFHPLTEFLPKEDFNLLVSSCGIVIMNHIRQQGLGTLLSQLWMGAKVFLNPASPVYKDLKYQDVEIFNSLEIDQEALEYNGPYNDREKLLDLFGKKNSAQCIQELEEILR